MSLPVVLMSRPMRPLVARQLTEKVSLVESHLQDDPDAAIAEVAADVRGLACIGQKVDAALLDRFPKLEIIANFGVGYDNIDASACAARGVMVTNTPDVLTEEVADTALGLLIMTVREFGAAERHLRAGKWEGEGAFPLTAGTLRGRTLGIVGLGRIGKAIAERAEAFGLKIAYHGRSKQAGVAYPYFPSVLELAAACDTLMLVVPGGAETRHMVDKPVLEALGRDGVLINVGRGTLVDEAALIEALENGTILSAGLDVFEQEPHVPAKLRALENVVALPHVGSASVHTRDAMGQLVVDNLVSWFETGKPVTPVAECKG
ncbi:2-hydroxyacid dehydrogenase [Roseibium sp. CAU 1637]|uniref:2-hydroxyacid dehydrogenase n=1 Tax=Roseibium limicola TaxID=2816037 RepID=A0A939EQV7_9HYPH|nr:2-hydroxyacid dehydrogenase [Roseibium limicola]MBO0347009.1 2-hydroxyacid dehydrogenase [Roseibium limicola]